jgi:hypothetical protein
MPLKVIPLPEQHDAWERYSQLLDGLQEVGAMSVCTSIIEIKVSRLRYRQVIRIFTGMASFYVQELLDLRSYQPPSPNRGGIVRSLSRVRSSSRLVAHQAEFTGFRRRYYRPSELHGQINSSMRWRMSPLP